MFEEALAGQGVVGYRPLATELATACCRYFLFWLLKGAALALSTRKAGEAETSGT